jgi:hypothetical protein
VRVRIDQPGYDHATGRVDPFAFDVERVDGSTIDGANLLDAVVRDEDRLDSTRLRIVDEAVLDENEHAARVSGGWVRLGEAG